MSHYLNRSGLRAACASTGLLMALVLTARGDLYTNLSQLQSSVPVGSGETLPGTDDRLDGPKWIATGDPDKDGNADFAVCHLNGEISVAYGRGDGSFHMPVIYQTGLTELRAMVCADLDGDTRPDLAATSPFEGKIVVLFSIPGRRFAPPALLPAFKFVRNLTAGDFDGDGRMDLAAAGPDEKTDPVSQPATGVMHLRGIGGRQFQTMGTVPSLATIAKPGGELRTVYSLESFRPPGETRDWVVATYSVQYGEGVQRVWTMATSDTGVLEVKSVLPAAGTNIYYESPLQADGLKVGAITRPVASGQMDLLTARQQW
jgi:hypothetical protein